MSAVALSWCAEEVGAAGRGRHDEGTVDGIGRQDTVVADQLQAGRWGEGGQAADELQRCEHQVGGAVLPGRLEGEGEIPVVELLQAAVGQRRAVDVAAEAFEPTTVVGGDRGGRVQGEAQRGRR